MITGTCLMFSICSTQYSAILAYIRYFKEVNDQTQFTCLLLAPHQKMTAKSCYRWRFNLTNST